MYAIFGVEGGNYCFSSRAALRLHIFVHTVQCGLHSLNLLGLLGSTLINALHGCFLVPWGLFGCKERCAIWKPCEYCQWIAVTEPGEECVVQERLHRWDERYPAVTWELELGQDSAKSF